jgi:hypothetical protein
LAKRILGYLPYADVEKSAHVSKSWHSGRQHLNNLLWEIRRICGCCQPYQSHMPTLPVPLFLCLC